jgi:hypothetical protein
MTLSIWRANANIGAEEISSDHYCGLQAPVRCGAICLIALFAALSNQERSASKQLAPQLPYTQSQSALIEQKGE